MYRLLFPILLLAASPARALDLMSTASSWTQEISQACATSTSSSADEKLACTWPAVFNEFVSAKKEVSSDSSLLLSLASGVFEFDAFNNAKPIDARVARYLMAIRFVRQTWPFAQTKLSKKNFNDQALVTASLTSTDGWSTLWSAYSNLDCTRESSNDCRRAKTGFLVNLNAAVQKIEADLALKMMINTATDENTADIVLGGDIKLTLKSLEKIVGSFTGANPSFYFVGAGDTYLMNSDSKLQEWSNYQRTSTFNGFADRVELAETACDNLLIAAKTMKWDFRCRNRDDGGIEVIDRSIFQIFNSAKPTDVDLMDASVHQLRENLADVLQPTHFESSRIALIKLLHQVSSYEKARNKLATLWASTNLARIGTQIPADSRVVDELVGELTQSYFDAKKAGLQ